VRGGEDSQVLLKGWVAVWSGKGRGGGVVGRRKKTQNQEMMPLAGKGTRHEAERGEGEMVQCL